MISAPVCQSACLKPESGPAQLPGGLSHEKDGPRDSVQNPLPRIDSPFCAGLGAICGARWCVELRSLRASKHSCKGPVPGSKDRHTAEGIESRFLTSGVSVCFCCGCGGARRKTNREQSSDSTCCRDRNRNPWRGPWPRSMALEPEAECR